MPKEGGNFLLYLGIFIISISIIVVEVVSTRLIRIAFEKNILAIILSLAILGISFGAMFVYFLKGKTFIKRNFKNKIVILSLLYSLSILTPFFILPYVNSDFPSLVNFSFFFTSFINYFFWGACVMLIFTFFSKNIPELYGFNLMGNAFGAFFAILSLNWLGNEKTLLATFMFSLLAVLFFSYTFKSKRWIYLFLIAILIGATGFSLDFLGSKIKIKCAIDELELYSASNSYSQVDIYESQIERVGAEWSTEFYAEDLSSNLRNFEFWIDCKTVTGLLKYSNLSEIGFLSYDISYFPFYVQPYEKALILGSGAGSDIDKALLAGVKEVHAVEINPLIIKKVFSINNKSSYNLKNVFLYTKEARNFILNSGETYDLIYLFRTKRFGKIGVSSYAFIENYLFTTEAFDSYLTHLSNNGVLAIVDRNRFIQRYVSTLISSLEKKGLEFNDRIMVVNGERYSVLLVKNGVFSNKEKEFVLEQARELGFNILALNGSSLNLHDYKEIVISDNRPFLYNRYSIPTLVKGGKLKSVLEEEGDKPFIFILKLFYSLAILTIIFSVSILVPKKLFKEKSKNINWFLLYFSLIGIGFITFEIGLIQKFTLPLGHPTLSISVGLSAIFLFSGLGSIFSRNFDIKEFRKIIRNIIILLCIYIALFMALYGWIFKALISSNPFSRIAFIVFLLILPSFFMGMFFPVGLKLTALSSESLLPWMWGINGITTIIGGVLSLITSILFGYNIVLLSGILAYLAILIPINKISLNPE